MKDIERRLYQLLGADAEQFGYAFSGKIQQGWRRYFPQKTAAEELVEKSWRVYARKSYPIVHWTPS